MEKYDFWGDMLAAAGMDPNTPPPEWMQSQTEAETEFYRYTVYISRNDPAKDGRAMSECINCKTLHECIMQISTCTEYDNYIVEAKDESGRYKIIEHGWDDQESKFYDRTQGTNGKIENVWLNTYTYKKHS